MSVNETNTVHRHRQKSEDEDSWMGRTDSKTYYTLGEHTKIKSEEGSGRLGHYYCENCGTIVENPAVFFDIACDN